MTDFHKLPNHGLPKETLDRFNEIVKETGDKKMIMVPRIFELEQKIKEYDQLFSLQFAADGRATKMWQEANPGNDMVWPDSAKLSVWLLVQLDTLRCTLSRHDQHARMVTQNLCKEGPEGTANYVWIANLLKHFIDTSGSGMEKSDE